MEAGMLSVRVTSLHSTYLRARHKGVATVYHWQGRSSVFEQPVGQDNEHAPQNNQCQLLGLAAGEQALVGAAGGSACESCSFDLVRAPNYLHPATDNSKNSQADPDLSSLPNRLDGWNSSPCIFHPADGKSAAPSRQRRRFIAAHGRHRTPPAGIASAQCIRFA